jgi:hypothetical protein
MDSVEEFKKQKGNKIYIKSPIMRGMARLLIESIWRVDHVQQSIHFANASLISYYEKRPLSPFDVPDRHIRSARRIGARLFDVKRFDRLILFEVNDPATGHLVTRDDETRMFLDSVDAKLFLLQRGEGGQIETQALNKSETRKAQHNSAEIRTEMLRLMIQALTGDGAIERIKTLKKRGAHPIVFEKIWCDSHDTDDIPAALRSIIHS